MPTWNALNRRIIRCEKCPRLRRHCQQIAHDKRRAYREWDYWGRPVPNFGDLQAPLLLVGLAPAAHGANRTGRMFTGDRSGDWLYRALHKAGFASQPESTSATDGLQLVGAAITAVCHCAPPGNRPTAAEMDQCAIWLHETVALLRPRVFLALGRIAWQGCCRLAQQRNWLAGRRPAFGHGAVVRLGSDRWLIGSYHPSQQNTFTGRLTELMLDDVFVTAGRLLRPDAT